jgi:hypothetical protein|tara:strand:- start:188 stop:400 length:213 start_codon:yes stop_codon:yes gene_type:complete
MKLIEIKTVYEAGSIWVNPDYVKCVSAEEITQDGRKGVIGTAITMVSAMGWEIKTIEKIDSVIERLQGGE